MSNHTLNQEQTQEIPYGHCHCGCGQLAPIAKYTWAACGWIKGQPKSFIRGHNGRKHPRVGENTAEGLCECGCGQKTNIAAQTVSSLGHVQGKPMRFLSGHATRIRPFLPLEEVFWQIAVRGSVDSCWEWQGNVHSSGYGILGHKGKRYRVHRLSYEFHYGPIAKGLFVCHKCDNPTCWNPDHLFLGTQKDNMRDCANKRRIRGAVIRDMEV